MADLTVVTASVATYEQALSPNQGVIQTVMAGASVTAGQPVYQHTDGTYKPCDSSTAAKAAAVGVALNAAATGQPFLIQKSGGLNPGATVAVGQAYGVTATAGGIGPISDRGSAEFMTFLGFGTTTSRIELDVVAAGVAIP